MARIDDLVNFLTDISTAIKTKTGITTPIPAAEFDTQILSIQTVGNYQTKSASITANGNYSVSADQDYDALDTVNITVNVPAPPPALEDITLTQNGVYKAGQAYDGFGEVTVRVAGGGTGDVKLFPNEQSMQADENPRVGDLAVIYDKQIQPATQSSTYTAIYFPNTVQFETAIDSSHYSYFGGQDWANINVDNTSAQIMIYSSSQIIIEYTSSDGLTYTKTTGPNKYESDSTISMYSVDEVCAKFLLCESYTFGGLYKYSDKVTDYDKVQFYGINDIDMSTFTYDSSAYTWDGTYSFLINYADLKPTLTAILNDDSITKYSGTYMYMYIKDNKYYVISSPVNMSYLGAYQNEGIIGIANVSILSSATTHTIKIYELDLENTTYTLINTLTSSLKSFTNSSSATQYFEYIPIIPDSLPIQIYLNNLDSYYATNQIRTVYQVPDQTYYSYTNKSYTPSVQTHPYKSEYVLAPTQLRLTASQALTNTIAYSNNGVIEGIMTNLGSRTITPSLERQTIEAGYTTGITISPVTASVDEDIKSKNIIEGVEILGVEGEAPDVTINYIGDGYKNQVYKDSASSIVNKATMFYYNVGSHGGSTSVGIYDKDGEWIGLFSGSNETWTVEKDGSLAHKTSITAPNLQFGAYSSAQADGVEIENWKNNQCRVWYIPYGSGYIRYIRCVTFVKNSDGAIVYDSSLPHWQFILPSQTGYSSVTNSRIVLDPNNEGMATIICNGSASSSSSNDRVLFYTLKLDSYTGSGWGTMTCGDIITSIPTSGKAVRYREECAVQYRANSKIMTYCNYGGSFSNPTQILFMDENGFAKYITSISSNVIVFKHDMTKCLIGTGLYNVIVDYDNHTASLGSYIASVTNVGRNIIGDRYDNYLLGNSSTSGYPDVYYTKLYKINWETGSTSVLLSTGMDYSFESVREYQCGNLSHSSLFSDGSWFSSNYGSFLSIRILKKIESIDYQDINYTPYRPSQTKTITPQTYSQSITADSEYELEQVIVNPVTSSIDNDIQSENIRQNVDILGVTGTLEPITEEVLEVTNGIVDGTTLILNNEEVSL